jgi:hypothetical protein
MPILHVPLDLALHEAGANRKGKRSWERYIHDLIARDLSAATGNPTQGKAPVATPTAIALDAADRHVKTAPVEPAATTTCGALRSADEILRDLGHADFQGGVLVSASASLTGAAVVTAEVE